MTRHKTASLIVGFFVAVLVTTGAVYVQYFGIPKALLVLLQRPVTEPTSDEYEVYSAFLDQFFASHLATSSPGRNISDSGAIFILDETNSSKNPSSVLPLDVVALGSEEMGLDFFRQNSRQWRLEPRFVTRMQTKLVRAAPKLRESCNSRV